MLNKLCDQPMRGKQHSSKVHATGTGDEQQHSDNRQTTKRTTTCRLALSCVCTQEQHTRHLTDELLKTYSRTVTRLCLGRIPPSQIAPRRASLPLSSSSVLQSHHKPHPLCLPPYLDWRLPAALTLRGMRTPSGGARTSILSAWACHEPTSSTLNGAALRGGMFVGLDTPSERPASLRFTSRSTASQTQTLGSASCGDYNYRMLNSETANVQPRNARLGLQRGELSRPQLWLAASLRTLTLCGYNMDSLVSFPERKHQGAGFGI